MQAGNGPRRFLLASTLPREVANVNQKGGEAESESQVSLGGRVACVLACDLQLSPPGSGKGRVLRCARLLSSLPGLSMPCRLDENVQGWG